MNIPYYEKNEYVRIFGKRYKVIHPGARKRRHKKTKYSKYNFTKINPSGTRL